MAGWPNDVTNAGVRSLTADACEKRGAGFSQQQPLGLERGTVAGPSPAPGGPVAGPSPPARPTGVGWRYAPTSGGAGPRSSRATMTAVAESPTTLIALRHMSR